MSQRKNAELIELTENPRSTARTIDMKTTREARAKLSDEVQLSGLSLVLFIPGE
jgi:hypothetical protein